MFGLGVSFTFRLMFFKDFVLVPLGIPNPDFVWFFQPFHSNGAVLSSFGLLLNPVGFFVRFNLCDPLPSLLSSVVSLVEM